MKHQRYNRRVPPDLREGLEEMVTKIIVGGDEPTQIASEVLYYVLREMRPDVFEDWKWGDDDAPKKTTRTTPTPNFGGKTTSNTTTIYGARPRDGLNYLGVAPPERYGAVTPNNEQNSWGKTPPPARRGSTSRHRAGYHTYR